ncbi:TPA: hypothetical protein N0F65_005419 [Lagenidium giganteum]|uniref:Uncharacterized protein n=1 Tax=Lagenidium giganteum TaxID=4803 RepID=A0AAV2YWW4_9STRA|nr:TPA: hypothetical protein N0F65_005419 [Lagenidium giganteum]
MRGNNCDFIRDAMDRWRRCRTKVFDHAVRFSWLRFLATLMSYVLLCSDVVRSGVGYRSYPYRSLEPDTQMFPLAAYPVAQIHRNNTDGPPLSVWMYKFDTTSIVWRALALLFHSTTFPDCIMYRSACPSDTINRSVVFAMTDDLVSRIAAQSSSRQRKTLLAPAAITFRSENVIFDKLHHMLPLQAFVPLIRRTNQALYYSPTTLTRSTIDFCARPHIQPSFCQDLWVNFARPYTGRAPPGSLSVLSQHIQRRTRALQEANPGMVVDLTILTGIDDCHFNLGGFSYNCYRGLDVTTVLRVRRCEDAESLTKNEREQRCETVWTDEYRYESGITTHDVVDWLLIVALLRVTAQVYVAVRLLLLFSVCYVVRRQEDTYASRSIGHVVRATLMTVAKLPCQGIVYGSPFPVWCYVAAHLIDAPMSYEVTGNSFRTLQGSAVSFSVVHIATLCAIQMRNVWLLALGLQLTVWLHIRASGRPVTASLASPSTRWALSR